MNISLLNHIFAFYESRLICVHISLHTRFNEKIVNSFMLAENIFCAVVVALGEGKMSSKQKK